MKTSKPISTISYNSTEFLAIKLTELYEAGKISFWAFVDHKPEDDEAGLKPHKHVYIEPSALLQTDDIKTFLIEPQTGSKPLGVLGFVSSNFDNWYMYALHDKAYLASKGQSRTFTYTHDDLLTSDPEWLLCKARQIDLLRLSPYRDMMQAIDDGVSWLEYFARGTVPLPQIRNYEYAWTMLSRSRTYRNNKTYDLHADSELDCFS